MIKYCHRRTETISFNKRGSDKDIGIGMGSVNKIDFSKTTKIYFLKNWREFNWKTIK